MEFIFHEKQDGSLCAQHCLNNLLQSQYFSPVDLATLALKMDEEERKRMAEQGDDTEDYQKFLAQPSGNFDDSGYFSVQVISSALAVWELDLIPFQSKAPAATVAQDSPQDMSAFICNYRDHWFTVRKIGNQWFNLNSLLSGPELISPTYLSIFLAQLQEEGYSIFLVIGDLPVCEADEILRKNPAVQVKKPKLNTVSVSTEDNDIQKAIKLSTGNYQPDEEEEMLQKAIQKSLEDELPDQALQNAIKMSLDSSLPSTSTSYKLRSAQQVSQSSSSSHSKDISPQTDKVGIEEEDNELISAIRMSLKDFENKDESPKRTPNIPQTPAIAQEVNPEEIRRRRLAYLEAKAKNTS